MKPMKKVICALLLALLLPGCSSVKPAGTSSAAGGSSVSKTGFPIVKQQITLKAFVVKGPYNKGDFNSLPIWSKYQDMSNVKVNFTAVDSTQATEQLGLLFASNELPDIIMKVNMSQTDITKHADEGSLVALSNYMDYAPNFKKVMSNDSIIKKSITLSNGKIYGLPYLVEAKPSIITPKLFINKTWVDAKGIKSPTNLTDLMTALNTFKESDFNGNGKSDEIPLGCDNANSFYQSFYGAFGLCNHGIVNGWYWDLDPKTSKLRYVPTASQYKEYLQYLNKLYTQKLVDQEVFTADIPKFTAKANQNLFGFAFIHNNNYLGNYKNNFITLPSALEGPNGDKLYSGIGSPVAGQCFFITKANKYPEATMRWVDYFYSDEGISLYFMGIEGVTWQNDSSGNPKYTDFVTKNPDGLLMEEVLGRYVAWSGGANPSIADDVHFGNQMIPKITVDAANALESSTPKEVWGTFTYSSDDSQKLTTVSHDIDTYVADMRAKFVTGAQPFSYWDTYVSTIQKMGLSDYTAIVQRGLDSYNKK